MHALEVLNLTLSVHAGRDSLADGGRDVRASQSLMQDGAVARLLELHTLVKFSGRVRLKSLPHCLFFFAFS